MSADTPRIGLGKAIIDGIIRDGLVRAEEANLCVWQAHAAEAIEAIAADWQENSEMCENCDTWHLDCLHDPEGVPICPECNEGLKEEQP